jgi:hypothetical protein
MTKIIETEFAGKKYKLQHPGARAWVKLRSKLVNIETKRLDMEKLLDYAFEHIVIPLEIQDGEDSQLNLDTIDLKELSHWEKTLPHFMNFGELPPEDEDEKKTI